MTTCRAFTCAVHNGNAACNDMRLNARLTYGSRATCTLRCCALRARYCCNTRCAAGAFLLAVVPPQQRAAAATYLAVRLSPSFSRICQRRGWDCCGRRTLTHTPLYRRVPALRLLPRRSSPCLRRHTTPPRIPRTRLPPVAYHCLPLLRLAFAAPATAPTTPPSLHLRHTCCAAHVRSTTALACSACRTGSMYCHWVTRNSWRTASRTRHALRIFAWRLTRFLRIDITATTACLAVRFRAWRENRRRVCT